jgi:hypothetical protein
MPRKRLFARIVVLLAVFASLAFSSQIIVQPILVGTGSTSNVAEDPLYTSAIYSQIGLGVSFLSEELITGITGTSIAAGTNLTWTSTTSNQTVFLSDASWEDMPEMTVWYVDQIVVNGSQARGVTFAGQIGGEWRFGIGVSLSLAARDTLAHEIGHMLTWLLYNNMLYFTCADTTSGCAAGDAAHSSNAYNLLASGTIRYTPDSITDIYGQGGTYDQITASQASFMLMHTDFVVPEPATMTLFGSGAALLFFACRRRAA